MRITRLVWADETVEHLSRHGVSPQEAEEASRLQPYVLRTRAGRYLALGQTIGGRYVTVIIAPLGGGRAKVITARPMTESERRQYLRR